MIDGGTIESRHHGALGGNDTKRNVEDVGQQRFFRDNTIELRDYTDVPLGIQRIIGLKIRAPADCK